MNRLAGNILAVLLFAFAMAELKDDYVPPLAIDVKPQDEKSYRAWFEACSLSASTVQKPQAFSDIGNTLIVDSFEREYPEIFEKVVDYMSGIESVEDRGELEKRFKTLSKSVR